MAKKVTKRDFDKDLNLQLDAQRQMIDLQKEELNTLNNIFSVRSETAKIGLDIFKKQQELNASKNAYLKLTEQIRKGEITVSKTTLDNIKKEQIEQQKAINKLKTKQTIFNAISKLSFTNIRGLVTALNSMAVFDDKPIRDASLYLGFGAEKSQLIRDAFYAATPQVNILGAKMEDLAIIQKSYTDETGRAIALTSQQLVQITEIAKGTGLATDEAGRLAAQFELLGNDTANTHRIIQGIVDSSERMGVSSQKILKVVGQNFNKLNTFAFKDGVNGMAKMAQYAEKFKINFDASINSAVKARTLEGAIEMAAELQILGGEFAKADPFELFHLSRNDPAEYTKRINETVKGMSSLVKTADGFQIKTSPQDLDRLRIAADALGIPFENLVEQSQRMAEIQAMNKQMMGTAFTKEDRELIQGMAKLDSESGIYKVLGKDISKLSAQEIESLKTQQKTLKERAEAAQTFDEKFQNTINSMKHTLIPLLDGINYVFDTFHPIMKTISEAMQALPEWTKKGLAILGGIVGVVLLSTKALGVASKIPFIGEIGKLFSKGGGLGKNLTGEFGSAAAGGGKGFAGAVGAGVGGGMSALGKGAGIGLAAAGIGGGIGLAADGIAKMANAFKELNVDQLNGLNKALETMGYVMVGMTVGLGVISTLGLPALLGIGAAAAGIGAAIYLASTGMATLSDSFGTLLQVADPSKVFLLAAGVTTLAKSMTLFAGGGILATLGGGGAFAMLTLLSMRADAFERIGNSMKEISVVMNSNGEGLKQLKETLDTISNVKSSGGILGELNNMIKNGIKVEFKDKNVALNVNVTTQIDSDIVANKVAKKIVVLQKGYQEGKMA